MNRVLLGLLMMLACLVTLAPSAAGAAEDAASAVSATTSQFDVPTLLLASRVLALLQEDQAGFNTLLGDLQASGDLTGAGAEKLTAWLNDAGGDYAALLTPAGSQAADSTFQGPLLPSQTVADTAAETTGKLGVALNADGSVQVQGVEQILALAGLGQAAAVASAAGMVLELDPENVGVYIPLTVNGTAVSAGTVQIEGLRTELQTVLSDLTPDSRIYTVPSEWKENAGAAWAYLRGLVGAKDKKAASKNASVVKTEQAEAVKEEADVTEDGDNAEQD